MRSKKWTGLMAHSFMVSSSLKPEERGKGKVWRLHELRNVHHQTPSMVMSVLPSSPFWNCTPLGKAEHNAKNVSGNAVTEQRIKESFRLEVLEKTSKTM